MVIIPSVKDGKIRIERGVNRAIMQEIQEIIKIFAFSAKTGYNNAKIKPGIIVNLSCNQLKMQVSSLLFKASVAFILIVFFSSCTGETVKHSQVQSVEKVKDTSSAINDIVSTLASSPKMQGNKIIAVVDFSTLEGNITGLGRYIAEELLTRLFHIGRYRVIERNLLEKAINELKFNASGYVSDDFAKNVGEMIGADAIVTGTITRIGKAVKVNARVIDVETGDILAAASSSIAMDDAITRLMNEDLKPLVPNSSQRSYSSIAVLITEERVDGENINWWSKDQSISSSIAGNAITERLLEKGLSVIDYFKLPDKIKSPINLQSEKSLSLTKAADLGKEINAGIIIIGKATARLQGEIAGMKSVRVNLSVRVINVENKKVLASASVSTAAVHINAESAEDEALKRAGQEAADKIIGQIKGNR